MQLTVPKEAAAPTAVATPPEAAAVAETPIAAAKADQALLVTTAAAPQ